MKLLGFWKLLKASLKDYWRHRAILVLVAAVAAVPLGLVGLISSDPSVRVYGSMLAVIMNLALIWSVVRLQQGQAVRLKQAYYEGTAGFVRYLLVSFLLILQLLPFVIGATIFSAATADVTTSVGAPEKILVGLLWLLLALPSAFWLTRSLFALLVVAQSDLAPLAAVRASRDLVKGRSWRVFGRLVSFAVLAVLVIIVPIAAGLIVLSSAALNLLLAILQLLVTVTVLPIFYIYLQRLYRALS